MRGAKITTPTVRAVGATEKVMVKPGMWLEFPAGLDECTKAARIAIFNDKLEASKATPGNYGPNRKPKKQTDDEQPEPEL